MTINLLLKEELIKNGIAVIRMTINTENEEEIEMYKKNNPDCIAFLGEPSYYMEYVKEKDTARIATEEEKYIRGYRELMAGEIFEEGKIKKIEIPNMIIKPIWKNNYWEEGATREELIEERKNKILEYEKLEEEKKILEVSKFSSEDEIKIIIEKITVLEGDINNLQEKIELL
jgi:hypothetical protein